MKTTNTLNREYFGSFTSHNNLSNTLSSKLELLLHYEIKLFHDTLNAHWNAEGSNFIGFHKVTEEQYNILLEKIDTIAERKRALGEKVDPIKNQTNNTTRKDNSVESHASYLVNFHRKQALFTQKLSEQFESSSDSATADLMNTLRSFHEKQAWLLESTFKS